jgi:hypothetical protein
VVAWISSGTRRRRVRELSQQVRAQAAEIGALRHQQPVAEGRASARPAIAGPPAEPVRARA